MAIKSINYQSEILLPILPCSEVQVCLASDWAAKTVSGVALANATVQNSVRELGSAGASIFRRSLRWNPRRSEMIQYTLDFDSEQFLNEEELPDCSDIVGINPYGCAVNSLLASTPVTPPVPLSATVPSAGTSLVLTFSEDVLPASAITGFSVLVGVTPNVITSATRTADRTITLALTTVVLGANTVTYSYAPGNVTDESGTPLAAITNAAVTNSSTQV